MDPPPTPWEPNRRSAAMKLKFLYLGMSTAFWVGRYLLGLSVLVLGAFVLRSFEIRVLVAAVAMGFWPDLLRWWGLLDARFNLHQQLLRLRIENDERPLLLILRSFHNPSLREGVRRDWWGQSLDDDPPPLGMRRIRWRNLAPGTVVDRFWSLTCALERVGPLVALPGASRQSIRRLPPVLETSSSEDWKTRVEALCAHARAIVFLPENTVGVLEEMCLLRDSPFLGRVMVFMPPGEERSPWSWQWGKSWSRSWETGLFRQRRGRFRLDWERVQNAVRTHGFELPPYDDHGLLYRPDQRFSPVDSVAFGSCSTADFANKVERLLERVPGPTAPARSLLHLL